MNHVNLTFHLATRRLIYQNSLFFFFFLFPHLLPIMAVGSMVETPRSWKASGSDFISELFAHWPLPGPGWHCQHQPTSSAHTGSSLFREIVSISQYRRFLPLIAWPVACCALRLQPHKHLHAQEIVYTRRPPACPHGRSLSHSLLPPALAHSKTPGELPRWGQILTPCEMLSPFWGWISCLGWISLSFGLRAKLEPSESPVSNKSGEHSLPICKK